MFNSKISTDEGCFQKNLVRIFDASRFVASLLFEGALCRLKHRQMRLFWNVKGCGVGYTYPNLIPRAS